MAKNNENQTQFQAVRPVFEQAMMGSVGDALTAEKKALQQTAPAIKKRKVIALVFLSALLLFILVLIKLTSSFKTDVEQAGSVDNNTNQIELIEKTEFEQKIDNLKDQLNEADPAKQEILFPPVEVGLGV